MKKLSNLFVAWLTAAAIAASVQSCDVVGGYVFGSEAVSYRDDSYIERSASAATIKYTFTARDEWSAESDNPSMLAIRSATSGAKGVNTMTLDLAANTTGRERTANIIIKVTGYDPEVLVRVTQRDSSNDDYDVNASTVDPCLSENYLWNDEYNSLTRDFDQNYDDFLRNTLLGMKTNTEDGSYDSKGERTKLYSYIERTAVRSTRAAAAKEPKQTFGVINVVLVTLTDYSTGKDNGKRAMCVSGVYEGTPAARAGLNRGTWITAVDGHELTPSNINEYFSRLVAYPAAGDRMTLTVADSNGGATRNVTVTAEYAALNPVIYSEVKTVGSTKVGYLVYGYYEMSYDAELLAEIAKLRAAGITELVLDLRLNTGGHVNSAQMLASIIAGNSGDGKVFVQYEYNNSRMKSLGFTSSNKDRMNFGPGARLTSQSHSSVSDYSRADYLNLSRVYILVGARTASAAELTVHALRGIDFPVTTIGAQTEGKNVGMEGLIFDAGNYRYSFYPITFRIYNAKNVTYSSSGIVPDSELNEWSAGDYTYWPWGSEHDPLLAGALSMISGIRPMTATRGGDTTTPVTEIYECPMPDRGIVAEPID